MHAAEIPYNNIRNIQKKTFYKVVRGQCHLLTTILAFHLAVDLPTVACGICIGMKDTGNLQDIEPLAGTWRAQIQTKLNQLIILFRKFISGLSTLTITLRS